jgi:hypothetical protein
MGYWLAPEKPGGLYKRVPAVLDRHQLLLD